MDIDKNGGMHESRSHMIDAATLKSQSKYRLFRYSSDEKCKYLVKPNREQIYERTKKKKIQRKVKRKKK